MALPKYLTTVTTLSKYMALSMFVLFPILAFFIGRWYERELTPISSFSTCAEEGIQPLEQSVR